MKKLSLLLVFALCAYVTVSAQSDERSQGITTKSGAQILPAAGDYAIGVSANSFLEYAGKFLSTAGASAPSFDIDGVTIYGKYFLAPDRAIRAKLGLDLSKATTKTLVPDVVTPDKFVDDVLKSGTTGIDLNVGYELRRGYGRLQGFYGAEVDLAYFSTTDSWEYGNAITSTNPVVGRPTKTTSGGSLGFGIGGFVGVEYFIAPKISIGAEVNIGLALNTIPKGETTVEGWDGSKVKEDSTESYNADGTTKFGTFTGGNLFLLFHF
jgi:hypothetical protein